MNLIPFTNWEDDLVDDLDDCSIEWILGRLNRDGIGSSIVHPVSNNVLDQSRIKYHIDLIHSKGFKFNYLADSICLGNLESSSKGLNSILQTIGSFANLGIDGVTVANPLILDLIKSNFPCLKVGLNLSLHYSQIAKQGDYFNNTKADWIILPVSLNRRWGFLTNLKEKTKTRLWLVANAGCIYNCLLIPEHANFLSHTSNNNSDFLETDYFHAQCAKMIMENPYYLMSSRWIRPEDLYIYEDIGYSNFIIMYNKHNTKDILRTVKAYNSRSFKGDLAELLSFMGRSFYASKVCFHNTVNSFLNNEALEGFVNGFPDKECSRYLCEECRYCINEYQKRIELLPEKERGEIISECVNKINDYL